MKALITTAAQPETDAAAAADATVQVARFATSTGVGTNARAAGASREAIKKLERSMIERKLR